MFKENLTAFKNFKRLIKCIHQKKPDATKEQIRYGLYVTMNDLCCGIVNLRTPYSNKM